MARSSRGLRSGGQLIGAEHVLAVEIQHPVGVINGVEIALAEVWGDCHGSEVIRAVTDNQSIAPLMTVPVEPPNRNPLRAN